MRFRKWEKKKGYISNEDRAEELIKEGASHLKEAAQLIVDSDKEKYDTHDVKQLSKIVSFLNQMTSD